jgi:hypothetical protein
MNCGMQSGGILGKHALNGNAPRSMAADKPWPRHASSAGAVPGVRVARRHGARATRPRRPRPGAAVRRGALAAARGGIDAAGTDGHGVVAPQSRRRGDRRRGAWGPNVTLLEPRRQPGAAVRRLRRRLTQGITKIAGQIFAFKLDEAPGVGMAGTYSVRNASTGEMDAARLAGMRAANRAQMANALAAALSANGSQLATP